jgi:hypothetical protein
MKKVYTGVDKNLMKIYLNILRKSLEIPENWKKRDYDDRQYESPPINDESKLNFRTCRSNDDNYLKEVMIMDIGDVVIVLNIRFFDRKTRKLLKRLYYFMSERNTWVKSQKANRILKEALGAGFERAQKLLKLKKKIAEEWKELSYGLRYVQLSMFFHKDILKMTRKIQKNSIV